MGSRDLHDAGENVYAALGRTPRGRRLLVFFIYKPRTHDALILSAREPSRREWKLYERFRTEPGSSSAMACRAVIRGSRYCLPRILERIAAFLALVDLADVSEVAMIFAPAPEKNSLVLCVLAVVRAAR